MFEAISRNGILLAVFAIICTASVSLVSMMTKPVIAQQEQRALLKTVDQLIPQEIYNNDLFASCFYTKNDMLLGKNRAQKVFLAKKNNQPVAMMIESSTFKGYSGEIKLAVAILADGTVSGVRVLHHTETPGLGDKVETRKTDWIYAFNNMFFDENQPEHWEVKKNGGDIDAFTGATITPRAVTLAVRDTLIYFSKHKQMLFNHAPDCSVQE